MVLHHTVISVSGNNNTDIRNKHQWYVLEGVLMSAFKVKGIYNIDNMEK